MIGKSVIRATTEALILETGLSPESQQNVLVRLSRFGVTEEDIWEVATERYERMMQGTQLKENFMGCLRKKAQEPELVAAVSAILHIIDEVEWNLLPEPEAKIVSGRLISEGFCLEKTMGGDWEPGPESILQCLTKAIAEFIIREIHSDIPG